MGERVVGHLGEHEGGRAVEQFAVVGESGGARRGDEGVAEHPRHGVFRVGGDRAGDHEQVGAAEL